MSFADRQKLRFCFSPLILAFELMTTSLLHCICVCVCVLLVPIMCVVCGDFPRNSDRQFSKTRKYESHYRFYFCANICLFILNYLMVVFWPILLLADYLLCIYAFVYSIVVCLYLCTYVCNYYIHSCIYITTQ